MTPADVARVLTKASAFDQRTIGETDVMAWHEILPNVALVDALEAVTRHYTVSTERIMPADVLRLARLARDDRRRWERHGLAPVLALPSRYEADEDRDARLAAGIARCREAISS